MDNAYSDLYYEPVYHLHEKLAGVFAALRYIYRSIMYIDNT